MEFKWYRRTKRIEVGRHILFMKLTNMVVELKKIVAKLVVNVAILLLL
ncbi:hypothetical protein SDC9_118767 [bioreactor metagenome]|uniref:Uncharacterized protein n=1 Tax=bioreactor metagenome TaxID=1076179 RepID=A0A645C1U7_9ZZZZ